MAQSFWSFVKGILIQNDADRTKGLAIQVSNSSTTATQTTIQSQQTADRTITLPDATDTLVGRSTTDTLANKTLNNTTVLTIQDSNLTIQDNSDNTKQVQFQASGVTTGTTRTLTVPDASTTLVGHDNTQTISNKTLVAPVISTIVNTGTLTLPTSTDTLVGRATTDTLTNKTLTSPVISTIVNSGTLTLPTSTDTLVGRATTDTLTNKTFDADGTGNSIINIENADIKTGAAIDASKIGDGSVSSTEFQYLNGVTSAIQTQLDGKSGITGTFTDNRVLRADGTTSVQDSAVAISDAGAITGVTELTVDNLNLNGSTVTNSSGSMRFVVPTVNDLFLMDGVIAARGAHTSASGRVEIYESTDSGGSNTAILPGSLSGNTTVTLPTVTTTLVGTDATQTLSNKTVDNSSTITVKDANLTIQDDADATKQAKFQASGITAGQTRTLTIPDASTTLVGTDTTQALTNKDIDGGTASNSNRLTLPKNTKTNLDGLTRKEGTIFYSTDQDKVYVDTGSSLLPVGSGSGGSKNYLGTVNNVNLNGDFELGSTSGWSTFNTTLTGVIPTGTITAGSAALDLFQAATFAPISGTYSLQVGATTGTWTAGHGAISDAFTIDRGDQSRVMTFNFTYQVSGGTIVATGTSSNTFALYVYDVTNSAWIQPAGVYGMTTTSGYGRVTGTFQTTSNSTQYRFALICINAATAPVHLYLDDFSLGPQTAPIGPVVTDWQSFTPTGSWSTNTTYTGRWRRVGDSMEVQTNIALSGAPTSAALSVNLPSGFTIDTAKLANGTNSQEAMGWVSLITGSNTKAFNGVVWYNSTTSVAVKTLKAATTDMQTVDQSVPGTFASGDGVNIQYRVPIVGWSSNVQMSNDTDTRVVAVTLSGTSTTVNNTFPVITPTTIIKDTHGAFSGSTYSVPVSGFYRIDGYFQGGSVAYSAGHGVSLAYKVNGGSTVNLGQQRIAAAISASFNASGSGLVFCNAGDTIQFAAYSDVSNTPLGFFAAISRVSGPSVIAATESVCMRANASGTIATSSSASTVVWDTKVFDSHNAYSTSTGKFTVPVSGIYRVNSSAWFGSSSGSTNNVSDQYALAIRKNSTDMVGVVHRYEAANVIANSRSGTISGLVQCVAGDTLEIRVTQEGTNPRINTFTTGNYFEVERVGN